MRSAILETTLSATKFDFENFQPERVAPEIAEVQAPSLMFEVVIAVWAAKVHSNFQT